MRAKNKSITTKKLLVKSRQKQSHKVFANGHKPEVNDAPPHVGFGCIIRDSHGIVLAATQGRMHGNNDPAMAQALAIHEALSWIKNLHLSTIIMESDALLIIEALNRTDQDSSNLGLIIEDCKLLARDVSSCSFSFARRSANQAAHALARGTASMPDLVESFVPCPTVISNIIVPDLIS
ncbi:uncharacterized protein [Henckelia pumila]|uniref:uncharacterized protein n=1 Tax=Henckelia pumila TaxID=405737 RepID=UPI003C6DF361